MQYRMRLANDSVHFIPRSFYANNQPKNIKDKWKKGWGRIYPTSFRQSASHILGPIFRLVVAHRRFVRILRRSLFLSIYFWGIILVLGVVRWGFGEGRTGIRQKSAVQWSGVGIESIDDGDDILLFEV